MNFQEMHNTGDRLRRLAVFAGLSLTAEEIDRLTPLQEFLMAGLQRVHALNVGEQEPLILHVPREDTSRAGQ
jgi:hypothetical protein